LVHFLCTTRFAGTGSGLRILKFKQLPDGKKPLRVYNC